MSTSSPMSRWSSWTSRPACRGFTSWAPASGHSRGATWAIKTRSLAGLPRFEPRPAARNPLRFRLNPVIHELDIEGGSAMAFELPPLPYSFDALEPHIDAKTMQIHHDRHHAAYVNNANAALAKHPYRTQRSDKVLWWPLHTLPPH